MLTEEQKVLLLQEIDKLVNAHHQKIEKLTTFQTLLIEQAPISVTYQRRKKKIVKKENK